MYIFRGVTSSIFSSSSPFITHASATDGPKAQPTVHSDTRQDTRGLAKPEGTLIRDHGVGELGITVIALQDPFRHSHRQRYSLIDVRESVR